ncbi:hypothetical protein FACS1894204_06120 [Synergistales bacterium]|nr:hypothetical protein FACS1894204_06120 [Synergistales bacterium]
MKMMMLILLILLFLSAGKAWAKGGGSKTVDAVGPKSENLINLENQFYAAMNPIIGGYTDPIVSNGKRGTEGTPQPYDNSTLQGRLFNDATQKTFASNARYDDLLAQSPGLTNQMTGALAQGLNAVDRAAVAGDPWYKNAEGAFAQANNLLGQQTSNLKYATDTDKWYSDYAKDQLSGAQNLMNTGQVPQPILDALNATVNQGLNKSMGQSLNSLASRGVLNSSVTNKGMSDMSQAAGDALNRGYLDAFNSVLGGYQGNANTAATSGKAFTDTFLDLNNAAGQSMNGAINLGNSYANTGSQRTGDLLSVANGYNAAAGGYGDMQKLNLAEREQLLSAVPQYYNNAASPMMPAYDFLQTMLTDHANSDKKDTIVKQGK